MTGDEAADAVASSFTIVRGDPTPAEIAAVTAVLGGALEEIAGAERDHTLSPTAWQRSQRPVRQPITRGRGTWRGFAG